MPAFQIRDCNPFQDEEALKALHGSMGALDRREDLAPQPQSGFPVEWDGQVMPQQAWVATLEGDPGEIAGLAWLFPTTVGRGYLGLTVHPAYRSQDLQSALIEAALEAAAQMELSETAAYVRPSDLHTLELLEKAGFSARQEAVELQAPEGSSIPSPELPDGYFLRKFSEFMHLPTLAALMSRSLFETPWNPENDPKAITEAFLKAQVERYPQIFAPERIFLLLNSYGKAVAHVRVGHDETIQSPRVVPEERENGLQLSLVLVAMEHLRRHGAGVIRLFSEGESKAQIDRYRSLGFTHKKQFTVMSRNL